MFIAEQATITPAQIFRREAIQRAMHERGV
jgi:hypothetical protein